MENQRNTIPVHTQEERTQSRLAASLPSGYRMVTVTVLVITLIFLSAFTHAQEIPSTDQTADLGERSLSLGADSVQAIVRANQGGLTSSHAVVNQTLIGNHFEEGSGSSQTLLENSLQRNSGIVNVNQSSGNLNNQGIVRVLALATAGSVLQDLSYAISTVLRDNSVVLSGAPRGNRIANSFGESTGILGVNQSAGNLNQQANVLVLGLNGSSGQNAVGYQLNDENLGEVNSKNTVRGPIGSRSDVIASSFANFSGIAQVSQSAGDLNVIRNSIGISFSGAGRP